jgi:hypothetical protein
LPSLFTCCVHSPVQLGWAPTGEILWTEVQPMCGSHCICQEKRLSKHFSSVIYLWFGAVTGNWKVQYLSAVLDTRTCKEAEVTTRSDLSMDTTLVLMFTTDCTQREWNSSIHLYLAMLSFYPVSWRNHSITAAFRGKNSQDIASMPILTRWCVPLVCKGTVVRGLHPPTQSDQTELFFSCQQIPFLPHVTMLRLLLHKQSQLSGVCKACLQSVETSQDSHFHKSRLSWER